LELENTGTADVSLVLESGRETLRNAFMMYPAQWGVLTPRNAPRMVVASRRRRREAESLSARRKSAAARQMRWRERFLHSSEENQSERASERSNASKTLGASVVRTARARSYIATRGTGGPGGGGKTDPKWDLKTWSHELVGELRGRLRSITDFLDESSIDPNGHADRRLFIGSVALTMLGALSEGELSAAIAKMKRRASATRVRYFYGTLRGLVEDRKDGTTFDGSLDELTIPPPPFPRLGDEL